MGLHRFILETEGAWKGATYQFGNLRTTETSNKNGLSSLVPKQ